MVAHPNRIVGKDRAEADPGYIGNEQWLIQKATPHNWAREAADAYPGKNKEVGCCSKRAMADPGKDKRGRY